MTVAAKPLEFSCARLVCNQVSCQKPVVQKPGTAWSPVVSWESLVAADRWFEDHVGLAQSGRKTPVTGNSEHES